MLGGRFGSVTGVLPTRELRYRSWQQARTPIRAPLGGPGARYDLAAVEFRSDPEEPRSRPAEDPAPTDARVGMLRGAGVSADAHWVGRIVAGILVVGLAVVVVVLLVAGVRKNDQIATLRTHGMPIQMTVSGCMGLLGGSGSNPVGYSCHGTFIIGGHHYDDQIPGNTLYGPGDTLAGITVASDPRLFTTPAALRSLRASGRVYVVPAILTVVLVSVVAGLAVLGRRRRT
jgi:hypothetical protein